MDSLASELRNAPRSGEDVDDPEGARFISMSDTLANKIADALEQAYQIIASQRIAYEQEADFRGRLVAAQKQALTEQKLLESEILDKGKWIDEKDLRIENLTQILDISADALSELVCLKDLKDKHGKTEHYLKRQPVAWDAARSALTQIDHGPLFPLRERIEQLEAVVEAARFIPCRAGAVLDYTEVTRLQHAFDQLSRN